MLARLAVWEREMMSEERACATLEGAGRILADGGCKFGKIITGASGRLGWR